MANRPLPTLIVEHPSDCYQVINARDYETVGMPMTEVNSCSNAGSDGSESEPEVQEAWMIQASRLGALVYWTGAAFVSDISQALAFGSEALAQAAQSALPFDISITAVVVIQIT